MNVGKHMVKLIDLRFLAGLFALLIFTNSTFAQPQKVELEYEVSRNGHAFGTVKESYTQDGNRYQITSTTKGDGLYALLGERVLTSSGTVTKAGLVPAEFKLKRGDNEKKSLVASFDWATNTLNMLVKGDIRKEQLLSGAQDLASYPYQFMFTPPTGSQVKVALTTGKKFDQYIYNIESTNLAVNVAGTQYETVHLVDAEADGKKKKELWLAPSKHYIPVKYLVVDKDGDMIEQVLTKIIIK
jgi:uncharacterized protein DUF3108